MPTSTLTLIPVPLSSAESTVVMATPSRAVSGPSSASFAVRTGGFLFAGKLFTYALRLVGAVITARILGASGNGLFTLTIAVATLLASFGALGLDTAVVRYVSVFRSRGDRAGVLGTLQVGVGLPTLASIALGAVVFVFADAIAQAFLSQPDAAPTLRVASLLIPGLVISNQLSAALQGSKRLTSATLATQFVQPATRIMVLLVLAMAGLTALGAVAGATVAVLAGVAMMCVSLGRLLGRPLRGARRDVWSMLRFALPVYFSNIVTTVGSNLQIIMLTALGSLAAVGIFAVADQLNLISALFHTSIVAAAMPLFAQLQDENDIAGVGGLYRTTSLWTFALDLPVFLVVVLVPAELLSVFGPEFTNGAPALVILAVAALVNVATGTSGAVLDMTGHTNVKFLNATLSASVAIVLGLLLIPSLQMLGAAISVFAATALVNIVRVVEVAALVHVTPYDRAYLKPILAAGVSALASIPVLVSTQSLPPWVRAATLALVVVIVYVLVLVKVGVSPADRKFLRGALDRTFKRPRGMSAEPYDDR